MRLLTDVHAVSGHGVHRVPVAAEEDVGLSARPSVGSVFDQDLRHDEGREELRSRERRCGAAVSDVLMSRKDFNLWVPSQCLLRKPGREVLLCGCNASAHPRSHGKLTWEGK